jgi:hypothetical protein
MPTVRLFKLFISGFHLYAMFGRAIRRQCLVRLIRDCHRRFAGSSIGTGELILTSLFSGVILRKQPEEADARSML